MCRKDADINRYITNYCIVSYRICHKLRECLDKICNTSAIKETLKNIKNRSLLQLI